MISVGESNARGFTMRPAPAAHRVEVTPKSWMMPNRVGFPHWMSETFKYGALGGDPGGLYVHQRFVRDFLQPASPYRGLLLYHGLGVGKTCASIAVADVLRPPGNPDGEGKVFVMLPAVLRGNFIGEVRKCGDPRFRPEQTWRVVKDGFERSPTGISFSDLSPEDRDKIRAQIDRDIATAYNLVHYNGLSVAAVHKLCDGPENIFNDSVVVIDEAPNIISRVMGGRLFAHVYQRMMDAERCKIVLLSGTPLVNVPLELAYIVNLTHGYIREMTFTAIQSSVDLPRVKTVLEGHPCVDHVNSEVLVDGASIKVTLLPSGFVKDTNDDSARYVTASSEAPRHVQLSRALHDVASAAAGVRLKEPILDNRFLLPIDPDKFAEAFLDRDREATEVLNIDVLVRRLLGNISVYSSTDPKLMPRIMPAKVVRVEMSGAQFEEYLVQRDIERSRERAAARFATSPKTDVETKNLYRAFSRAVCTFVFPEGIKRPYRRDLYRTMNDEGDAEDGEEDEQGEATAKRINRAYDQAIDSALSVINKDSSKLLTVSGQLGTISPKYMAIMVHLLDSDQNRRPAIIYSQFRRAEGLGLLRLVLIANGFAELRVMKRRGILDVEVYPKDSSPSAPRFMVYGNEDPDAASAMLKIFNSQLSQLPAQLSSSLTALKFDAVEGNLHGAIARLLLITQSGSEGISTRNVREVHVVEPFWHANRILQVVGRAARAESHVDLPEDERSVDVFVYAATFTPEQIAANVTITKLDKKRTSDEHILAIATQKRGLLDKFIDVMRKAAVDCMLHYPSSGRTRCFEHGATTLRKGSSALSFQADLDIDIATQGRLVRMVPFDMEDGREGLADPVTGDVFDKITYTKHNVLKRVGRRRPSSIMRFQPPSHTRSSAR